MDADREDEVHKRLDRVLLDEFGLGEFGRKIVKAWVRKMVSQGEDGNLSRLKGWFVLLVNGTLRPPRQSVCKYQAGCPEIIPELTARPFWTVRDSPIVEECIEKLTRGIDSIRDELLVAMKQKLFQPYRAPTWVNPNRIANDGVGSLGHDQGDWNVIYLYLHNVDFTDNQAHFPKTMAILDGMPKLHNHVFFSALDHSTHVAPHNGPTNKKLRIHLPLLVPPGDSCRIRVGNATRSFSDGECLVFDDSFEHEAWNDHRSQRRVCLIVDIWHPELSPQEICLLKFLEKGKMKKVCLKQITRRLTTNTRLAIGKTDMSECTGELAPSG